MVNLNGNKTPLNVLLDSIANHTSGPLHITATDSDWSNIDGDRVTFYHGSTAYHGCGLDQPPQTSAPLVEPPSGSPPLVDLRRGRFLNVKGSDKTFHFQENVSPEMQRFFQNLAATKPRVKPVPSTDEDVLRSDIDDDGKSESLNEPSETADFIVINSAPGVKRR